MEAMIQQLKKMVVDQDSYLDCLNKRLASAMKNVTTEEGCNECERVFKKVCEEQARLRDLKQSLFYLRRAAGHNDIDTFNPERF